MRYSDRHKQYDVECIKCGYKTTMRLSDIKKSKRCEHLAFNGTYKTVTSHKWANKRLHSIFDHMKQRCYYKDNKSYPQYGAKGITIYDEWLFDPGQFEDWSLKNGYADNLTIDRIDSSKGYCPENCRWVSHETNTRYKSTTRPITVNGITRTGNEWANHLGLGKNIINKYVRKYGVDNTIEFIKWALENHPALSNNKSYYKNYISRAS